MATPDPILLVCENFPPVRGIGGRRWAKFAKELARRGHEVHVIRSTGIAGRLDSFWTEDVRSPRIIHHPLALRYPSVLTRRPLTTLGERFLYHFWVRVLPLFVRGNFYDASVFLRRRLLRLGGELIRKHGIRHVIVTGAPFRLMAFATEWKDRFPEINLVMDFRDEWTWADHYGFSTLSPQRQQYERDLEALVIRKADHVISPHEGMLEHLAATHSDALRHAVWIPHPVDPDDLPPPGPEVKPTDAFRMIYAGSLYDGDGAYRYFEELAKAFTNLKQVDPERFSNTYLDLYITGHGTDRFEQLVAISGLGEQIRFHAPVSPKAVLELQAAADLIPIFLPPDKKDVLVTKLNELFLLRRPILHIGDAGLVGRTITEKRAGASIRLEELAAELPRIIRGERRIEVDPEADHSGSLLAPITDRLVNEVLT